MEAIGGALFLLIGLYLDNVVPSESGVRKPFYFCLMPSFWCGRRNSSRTKKINHHRSITSPDHEKDKLTEFETKYIKPENYEPASSDLKTLEEKKKYLKIEELKKTFSNGFQAVSGINVKMYNGQIFALLGHNGAGKSTTISMLTGLIESSSGGAEVFGYDLFNEMQQVRSFLGVCPQHDVLFDLLTPKEHLEIFCDFKGKLT
jgi:ABC-type multidrug transport system fused ATPase/permease subunit